MLPLLAGLVLVDGTLLAFTLSRRAGHLRLHRVRLEPVPEAAIALVSEIAAAVVLLVLLAPRRRPVTST